MCSCDDCKRSFVRWYQYHHIDEFHWHVFHLYGHYFDRNWFIVELQTGSVAKSNCRRCFILLNWSSDILGRLKLGFANLARMIAPMGTSVTAPSLYKIGVSNIVMFFLNLCALAMTASVLSYAGTSIITSMSFIGTCFISTGTISIAIGSLWSSRPGLLRNRTVGGASSSLIGALISLGVVGYYTFAASFLAVDLYGGVLIATLYLSAIAGVCFVLFVVCH
eukprot:TRINITY_DN2133_c0_g1_i1.p1 TRINITY_DN2133_c0_g1~~TRINITY_DN2133_c0_g1_i1.p1  ORF type:complete len:221 (+),score=13.57 TRINITY_DN2133_c0_g1_i1:141-803(+)